MSLPLKSRSPCDLALAGAPVAGCSAISPITSSSNLPDRARKASAATSWFCRRLCRGRSPDADPFSTAKPGKPGRVLAAASTPQGRTIVLAMTRARTRPTAGASPAVLGACSRRRRRTWIATKTCLSSTATSHGVPKPAYFQDPAARGRRNHAQSPRSDARPRGRQESADRSFRPAFRANSSTRSETRPRSSSRRRPRIAHPSAAKPATTGPSSATP